MAAIMAGACATASAWASTNAISRSRSEPSAGGIGDGGIRLLKAAASKSFPLGKWRYRVALATLALRVTASTVTALGPPERSSAAAASSKRARDRAGRGSVVPPVIVATFSLFQNKTIGLPNKTIAGDGRGIGNRRGRLDTGRTLFPRSGSSFGGLPRAGSRPGNRLACQGGGGGRQAGSTGRPAGRGQQSGVRHGDARFADGVGRDRRGRGGPDRAVGSRARRATANPGAPDCPRPKVTCPTRGFK